MDLEHHADSQAREHAGVLLEMARLTAGPLGLAEVLRRIAGFALGIFKADGAAVFLYDERARTLTPAAVHYAADQAAVPVEENIALRLHEGSVFAAALESDGVSTLLSTDLPARDIIDLSRVGRLRLVPLRADAGTLGLLALANAAGRGGGDENTSLLAAVASLAAVIIAKARLIDNLERSEEKYRRLTENASDIVFALDASGRFSFLNSRVFDVLGYTPEELLGTYFSGIVTPESWQQTVAMVRQALADERHFLAYRWDALKKTGGQVTLEVSASLLLAHGEYQGQQGIARDMSERERLTQELARRDRDLAVSQRRQNELRDFLALVTRVQEDERRRISRELHDDTAQALVALGRRLETCRELLPDSPRLVAARLEELSGLVDTTLENLRRYCRELRPSVLDDLGLLPAVEWLLDGLKEYGIGAHLHVQGSPRRLSDETEVAVFRIVQEALNNVKQHAGSCRVQLHLSYEEERLRLVIADDGAGFDRARLVPGSGHLGLVGMNERAALLGGVLHVESRPGRGTRVYLEIPVGQNA